MKTEKMPLDEWFNELEALAPRLKNQAGYMKHVPLSALKFAKWTKRFQKLAKKNMRQNGGHLIITDFDTETTGLDPARKFGEGLAGVTDIGAVQIIDGKYMGNPIDADGTQHNDANQYEMQSLMNPGVLIPKAASDVTHITNEMVAQAPCQYKVLRDFKQFAKGSLLLGHNIGDDLQNKNGYDLKTVLEPIYGRYFNQAPGSMMKESLDSLPMFAGLVAGMPHTNTEFAKMFGVKLVGAHRAMPDVRVNTLAFTKLLPLLLSLNVDELETFAKNKLYKKNFMLTALRPGAKIVNGVKHEWVEFVISMDRRFNIGRKKNHTIIKFNLDDNAFHYEEVQLDEGKTLSLTQAQKAMPISVLKRQAKIKTRSNTFNDAIEPFTNTVF